MNKNTLIILGLGVAGYLVVRSARSSLNNINPASPDNFVNRAVTAASTNLFANVGQPPESLSDNFLIARATLLNPFASPAAKAQAQTFLDAMKFRNQL